MFCLHVSLYHMHSWYPWSQKRASDLWELKLQTAVSHHLRAGSWTKALYKSSEFSLPAERSLRPCLVTTFKIKHSTICFSHLSVAVIEFCDWKQLRDLTWFTFQCHCPSLRKVRTGTQDRNWSIDHGGPLLMGIDRGGALLTGVTREEHYSFA